FTDENEPTNGGVRALLSYGNWKTVGGNFPGANGETIPQTLDAIDSVTNENVKHGIRQKSNGSGKSIAVNADQSSIYIAGSITKYGEFPVRNLIKVDLTTGDLDPSFLPNWDITHSPDSQVNALLLTPDALYLGGNFTQYAGEVSGAY